MQSAGSFVSAVLKFSAGMKLGQDDFQRGFFWKFRMGSNGDTASIIRDRYIAFSVQLDFNARSMPGDGFVHRVINDFGEEVM